MRYKDLVLQQFVYLCGYLAEGWRIAHHIVINASEPLYEVRNRDVGIDECFIKVQHFFAVMNHNGNFGDAIGSGIATRRFNIHYCKQHVTNFRIIKV